jgi:hypothetical protein
VQDEQVALAVEEAGSGGCGDEELGVTHPAGVLGDLLHLETREVAVGGELGGEAPEAGEVTERRRRQLQTPCQVFLAASPAGLCAEAKPELVGEDSLCEDVRCA